MGFLAAQVHAGALTFLGSLMLLGALGGCGGKPEESAPEAAAAEAAAEPSVITPALAAVNDSLKGGAFDDAAARLLELANAGRNFTPEEAKEYRRALNEAYTKALEAAEKGDERAAAAIKMIRATGPN